MTSGRSPSPSSSWSAFDGRTGGAQRMPLRCGELDRRRQPGGVSGLAAPGCRPGERGEHRVVGVSAAARNPRYRNLFERSQRRRERPAVRRVSGRGLDRWTDADPGEFLRDRCRETPFLPHARYHFVSSTVTPTVLGVIAGDHLVRPKSTAGLGKSRCIPFEAELGLTLTGLNHFDLLNHPLVYTKLHDWLTHRIGRPASAIRAATSAATASVLASIAAR
jgi:hypothetical protein